MSQSLKAAIYETHGIPAEVQDELPRDRGHRAVGGRRLHILVFVSIKKSYTM